MFSYQSTLLRQSSCTRAVLGCVVGWDDKRLVGYFFQQTCDKNVIALVGPIAHAFDLR